MTVNPPLSYECRNSWMQFSNSYFRIHTAWSIKKAVKCIFLIFTFETKLNFLCICIYIYFDNISTNWMQNYITWIFLDWFLHNSSWTHETERVIGIVDLEFLILLFPYWQWHQTFIHRYQTCLCLFCLISFYNTHFPRLVIRIIYSTHILV